MKATDLAIDRSKTVFALMLMVVILGVSSYIGLPRESTPDVKIPFVYVAAPYFGTSPADMENLVARKLEKQLKGIPDLERMTSASSEGFVGILLEFKTDVEMSDALQKVRDAVEMAKPELPQDVREDLTISEISSDDWPIMQVTLSGEYDPILLKKAAESLQEEIERIPGVLTADLTGGVEQEVRVDVDPRRLRHFDLGLVDVSDAIRLENVTIPGGDLGLGTYNYQLRVPGEFESVEAIPEILLNPGEPTPVYLGDVAAVALAVKDPETISRLNGIDAVTLSVKKRSGENIIRISEEIKRMIDEIGPALPEGTTVTITGDVSIMIRDMVNELENNILSGLVLVVVVLFMFLGLRNSFFIGTAIPFSMLISFIVLSALGVTLNMVVLFSLILSLGMLVDNAIVIVENIYRFRIQGKGRIAAAKEATHQVSTAVIASTLTTLAAFGPLLFWPGIMGEFMKYLPLTVIVTLSSSLFVALVFNPVLCANLMSVPEGTEKKRPGDRLIAFGLRSYEPTIRWALRHRAVTLTGMFALLVAATILFGIFNSGVELFPDTDPTFAYASIEAPSGTRIEVSDAYARAVEQQVATVPDLKAYVADVGRAGGQQLVAAGGSSNHAVVSLEFEKKEEREASSRLSVQDLRDRLRTFTGAKLTIDKQEEGPPTGKPVTIEISGDDFPTLGDLAEQVRDQIRDIPGLVDLQDDYDRGRPEIRIRPSLEKAARYGLRTTDLASTIRTSVRGEEVSVFRIGEDEYDIVVRLRAPDRKSVEDIEDLTIFYEGRHVPLTAFADVRFQTGLGAIQRIDSKRVVTVTADAATGTNSNELLTRVRERLASFPLPVGYHIEYTGENEEQEKAAAFLEDAFGIAIMLILLILITQFTSLLVPFVIVASVVLSLIGVFAGLLMTGTAFGIIMTGTGVIALAGIVVNNAIVLLDYTNKLRDQGMEKLEAIVEAGKTRFRPVILTAMTTVLGLIPLTTGFSIDFARLFRADFAHVFIIGGESSQWWGPMGVAVIWGLAVATFLTLVVVPVMYSSIDPFLRVLRRPLEGVLSLFRRRTPAGA